MVREGASATSHRTPYGVLLPKAFGVIALRVAMNASAHSGGLNAEGCHNDRKRGSYHCHRGGGASSRSDAAPINTFMPSRIAPARASRSQGLFANCAEARAAGVAPVRRGEPGYGPHLDRDGNGVGCEPRRK